MRIDIIQRSRARVALPSVHMSALLSDVACLTLVIGLAFIFRIQFALSAPVFLQHDSEGYVLPAYDLYAGQGFGVGFRRTPLYPLFLASGLAVLGESLTAIVLVQHLLGVGTAALTYWLGRFTFGRLAGLVGGLLVAVNGALLIGEHYLMSEGLFIPLFIFSLLALLWAGHRPTVTRCLTTGMLLALAALCRPIAQALFPLVPVAMLLLGRPPAQALRGTVLVGLGVCALLVPWTLRNCLAYGECSTTGVMGQAMLARTAYYDHGFVFYDQSNPQRGPEAPRPAIRRSIQRASEQNLSGGAIARRLQAEFKWSDAETARQARELAFDVISRQPLYYATGTARMFWQIYSGEYDRLRADWKTMGRRINREEWEDRIGHLLSNGRLPAALDPDLRKAQSEADFTRSERLVNLWQPAFWSPWLPLLSLVGLAAALLRGGSLRGAAIYGLGAITLVLVSAAIDGPVARYRYPVDPLIGLLAAGGTGVIVAGVRAQLSNLSALFEDRRARQPNCETELKSPSPKLGAFDHEGA